MSINTHSRFFYGISITGDNQYIDFSEGAGVITAELKIGFYSLTTFASEISRALSAAGELVYTVVDDRDTKAITISASGNFSLYVASGPHLGTSAMETIGFSGADLSGQNSYVGNGPACSEYRTQFKLQSFIPSNFQTGPAFSAVNESANGDIEAVTFGEKSIIEMNFKYITEIFQEFGCAIRDNPNGVDDFLDFIAYATEKGPIEFMPDESDLDEFETIVLESTPDDKNGMRFKPRELYDVGLPGYYESGILKFRVKN